MVGAAAEMRFEEAAVYKKRIEALAAYQSKSVVVSNTLTNLDVFSLVVDDDAAYCNFMRIADGAVVNSFTVELKPGLEDVYKRQLYAAGQLEFHQRIDRLRSRTVDIEDPFESAQLELLARFLIDESRTVYGENLLLRRQRNRAAYDRPRTFHSLYDLFRR